jgi:4-hydroxybenzoate polyprenyltransferase
MNKFSTLIGALRISSLITGILVFLFLQVNNVGNLWVNLLIGFSFYIGTGAGMVINDIYDYENDKAAGKKNYLTTGMLSKKQGVAFFLILACISIFIQLIFFQNPESLTIYFIAAALVILYTPIVKNRFSFLKAPYVSLMSLTSLIFPILYLGKDLQVYLPVLAFAFIFIFSRENISDYYDYESDLSAGIKTLHHYFNKDILLYFSIVSLFVASTFSYFFVNLELGKTFALVNAIFTTLMIIIWFIFKQKKILKRGNLIAVLIAIFAIVFGF